MKYNIILLKAQRLLSQEEKDDANQCDIIEIVNTRDLEEETTSVGQNDSDEEDKVRNHDIGESIAIYKIFSPLTKARGKILKKNRANSTVNGIQKKAVKNKAKTAKTLNFRNLTHISLVETMGGNT